MNHLVFQTDFGLVDGAVSAMYGVAYSVNPDLKMHPLQYLGSQLSPNPDDSLLAPGHRICVCGRPRCRL